jgi:DNA-3-methyladenine glycosylase
MCDLTQADRYAVGTGRTAAGLGRRAEWRLECVSARILSVFEQQLPTDMPRRFSRKLDRSFFEQPALELAPRLIGTTLVRRFRGKELRARIIETEAYVGAHDLACHASKGRTARTEIMFGRAGHAYVYLIYGMYDMFNIVAGDVDDPQAVLIRGAVPLDGWQADLSGPGKLARALRISRAQNGIDLTGETLFLIGGPAERPELITTKRIGIDYAKEWKDAMLRFVDAGSLHLSKRHSR